MSSKTGDRKVISKTSKRINVSPEKRRKNITLKEQYSVIRDDLMKLREDIAKGYCMTKDWLDKRGNVRSIVARASDR